MAHELQPVMPTAAVPQDFSLCMWQVDERCCLGGQKRVVVWFWELYWRVVQNVIPVLQGSFL